MNTTMKTFIAALVAIPVGIYGGNYAFAHQCINFPGQVRIWNMGEESGAGRMAFHASSISGDGLNRKARQAFKKANVASPVSFAGGVAMPGGLTAPVAPPVPAQQIADLWNITQADLKSKTDIFGERVK